MAKSFDRSTPTHAKLPLIGVSGLGVSFRHWGTNTVISL